MAEAVDWPGLMRLGLGVLKLPPDAFWAMTPGELQRAAEGAGLAPVGGAPMGRGRLAELMAAFPDGPAAGRCTGGGRGAQPTVVNRGVRCPGRDPRQEGAG